VGDRERQNSAFFGNLGILRDTEGQGETPGCGQIAVKTCQPGVKIGLRPSVVRDSGSFKHWLGVFATETGSGVAPRSVLRTDARPRASGYFIA
jgi:hypothetical protein